ncbi:hypothetical protein JTE90_012826 [Oedothorax gibbosus]|uniref:60S ribosomal protein L29 n=1 Tax=Oedothorax gibbosus TaxID=931172 RepID=A0AAV6W296_9ARAC|nr:hypothetical protein JTE90_012826 [Oedothorax gibbosus]
MAKSKNHTAHNQNRKDHRNGIKRPSRFTKMSMRGMDAKFLKNLKYAKKHNKKLMPKVKPQTPKAAPKPLVK